MELSPEKAEYCLTLASLLSEARAAAGEADVLPGVADVAAVPEVHTLDDAIADLGKEDNLQRIRRALRVESTTWGLEESRDTVAAALFRLRDTKDIAQREHIRALLKDDWLEQTKDLYFRAFTLALEKDSKIAEQPLRSTKSLVAYEAAEGYTKAVKTDGERSQDKVRVAACTASMKAWDGLPPSGIITPIVLSLDGGKQLNDLLDPAARVKFDLDATGSGATWSWLRPTSGLLVWDPERTGRITSGRQLFGSVSWWMMFDNGYSALSALDDNRDGELRGQELSGIGVWFDRNTNGMSDAGEVTPIEQLGVVAVSTETTAKDGRSPMNPRGLRLADGRVLPTWDWVTEPVENRRSSLTPFLTLAAVASALFPLASFRRERGARGWSGECGGKSWM
jgi:hypothetical protein